MSTRPIHITQYDLDRLQKLILDAQATEYRKSEYIEKLRTELNREIIVKPHEIPPSVVTMNSTIELLDLDTHELETYTLVFPEDADLSKGRISILAPIGTAMLGYEIGDVFEWDVPAGKRHLRVERIIYQPEASGNFDL
ncbi:MAG: nucleoside diphosphate kinase regulator [Bacteroidota bacterium]